MDRPAGEARLPLIDALAMHPATRRWLRDHGAAEDTLRAWDDLGGTPTAPVGLYYVCPEQDYDDVLLAVPAQLPLCPEHKIPMTLVRG